MLHRHLATGPMTQWTLNTPLGPFTATIGAAGVHTLQFPQGKALRLPALETLESAPPVELVGSEEASPDALALRDFLAAYFKGCPTQLPRVDMQGLTAFQQRVALEAMKVRQGCRTSYGELARRVGQPKGARAVGGVMRNNRHVLLMPCHRVLARNGMGGFSGGAGLKEWLLEMEHQFVASGKVTVAPKNSGRGGQKNISCISS